MVTAQDRRGSAGGGGRGGAPVVRRPPVPAGGAGPVTDLKSWSRGPWDFTGLEVGGCYRGRVSGVNEDIGVFVDIAGARGLLRRAELRWGRVRALGDEVAVGDLVDVEVLDLDEAGGRMSLSAKRLEPNPWEALAARCAPGSFIFGRIAEIDGGGMFVEIGGGLEARSRDVDDTVDVGDERWFEVLGVDAERCRMALGLRGATGLNDALDDALDDA